LNLHGVRGLVRAAAATWREVAFPTISGGRAHGSEGASADVLVRNWYELKRPPRNQACESLRMASTQQELPEEWHFVGDQFGHSFNPRRAIVSDRGRAGYLKMLRKGTDDLWLEQWANEEIAPARLKWGEPVARSAPRGTS
jgi:hypothetical protein